MKRPSLKAELVAVARSAFWTLVADGEIDDCACDDGGGECNVCRLKRVLKRARAITPAMKVALRYTMRGAL